MIDHAGGIGSSNDYQLEGLIRVLGRTIEVEPERLGERLASTTRIMTGMYDVVEFELIGEASDAILSLAAELVPHHVINLYSYMSDQRSTTFSGAALAIIKGYLARAEWLPEIPASVLGNLLFPLPITPRPELLARLIEHCRQLRGEKQALELARVLRRRISIYVNASNRPGWNTGLASALDVDAVDGAPSLNASAPTVDDRTVEFNTGEIVAQSELARRIRSLADLAEIVEAEKKDSYFDWAPIVRGIVELDADQLERVIGALAGKRHGTSGLIALSQSLRQAGRTPEATLVAGHAVQSSQTAGWDVMWDSGTRIQALEELSILDGSSGRETAWKMLVGDLQRTFWYPRTFVLNLARVLLLLDPRPNFPAIWSEIEEYLDRLLRHMPHPTNPPQLVAATSHDASISLIDFVGSHMDHPVEIVRTGAKRALSELMSIDDSGALNRIESWLDHDQHVLEILQVLEGASVGAVTRCHDKILRLTDSRDFAIRSLAINLCDRVAPVPESRPALATSLPAIYSLTLPPSPKGE